MEVKQPSIFNDVLGPVMRGPSSSHTAASVRIGNLVRQFFETEIEQFNVEFDQKGSLATTYNTQGSDFGLVGGLLGMDLDDPELVKAPEKALELGISVNFSITSFDAIHPNTYKITAKDKNGSGYSFIFVSTGGGMIELNQINGAQVNIHGDLYETLLMIDDDRSDLLNKYLDRINKLFPDNDSCLHVQGDGFNMIIIKTDSELPAFVRKVIEMFEGLSSLIYLKPVLPIRSRNNTNVPFKTAEEIVQAAKDKDIELWKLAILYEMERGGITADDVIQMAKHIQNKMDSSIRAGLDGLDYPNRILSPQAGKMLNYAGRLCGGSELQKVIAYITAVMDSKSSMEVIVAAPTAGACGVLPGTLFAIAEEMQLGEDDILKGILAAAVIGLLIAGKSTFAAEECGCQAECGSASAMAASGLVQMLGGTVEQSLDAAAMALQNIMGLICDPVAERVEVPCLGKNVLAGINAIASANMSLAGFSNVIPLEETIDALHQVGKMLPSELCCTGGGGLSMTPSSEAIFKKLENKVEGN